MYFKINTKCNKVGYKVFSQWQSERENKNPCAEHCSFTVDLHKIQTLETSIVDMSVESLNFWPTKLFEEIVKENGEKYPSRSLYMIASGLQRHLAENCSIIRLLNRDEPRLVLSDMMY